MNRIILIGNGFDLAHGLPTSYKDFINWYWDEWIEKLRNCYKAIEEDKLCSFEIMKSSEYGYWQNVFQILPPEFWNLNGYDAIEKINSYHQLCRFKSCTFLRNICQSINTKGWVDIENEYYKLLKSLLKVSLRTENISERAKTLNSELEHLRLKLTEYLTQIQDKYLANGPNINPKIKKLIYENISYDDIAVETKHKLQAKINDINQVSNQLPNRIRLINFNYTKTADINNNADGSPDIKTLYIHGELSNPANIILGYGDELDDDFKNILNLNDNNMLKEIKSVRYLETDNYRKLLEFIESDLFQIYIMGHSCGNSDRTLLNTLFEHKNCVTIKPFYHKREDGTDDYMNIVQNIMRNFNDMKMMRDRVVNKTKCQALPQMNLQVNS